MGKTKTNQTDGCDCRKRWVTILFISIIVVGLFYVKDFISESVANSSVGCTTTTTLANNGDGQKTMNNSNDVRVEVYHFHRTQQCSSCIALGRLMDETVNASFTKEVESERLKSGHINIELPKNKEIVDRYDPTGSSLYIGTYINGVFYKEENTNVWYKLNNQLEYINYLTPILKKRLSGDLS